MKFITALLFAVAEAKMRLRGGDKTWKLNMPDDLNKMLKSPWAHYLQSVNMVGSDYNMKDMPGGVYDKTKTALYNQMGAAAYNSRVQGLQGNLCMPMNVANVAGNLGAPWSAGCTSEVMRMSFKTDAIGDATTETKFAGVIIKPTLNTATRKREWVRQNDSSQGIESSERKASNFAVLAVDGSHTSANSNFLDGEGLAYGVKDNSVCDSTSQEMLSLKMTTHDLNKPASKFDSFGQAVFTAGELLDSDFNFTLEFVHSTFGIDKDEVAVASDAVMGNWMQQMRTPADYLNANVTEEMEWTREEADLLRQSNEDTMSWGLKAQKNSEKTPLSVGNLYFHIKYVDPDSGIKYTLQTSGRPGSNDESLYFVPDSGDICKTGGVPVMFRTSHFMWYPKADLDSDLVKFAASLKSEENADKTENLLNQMETLQTVTDLTRNGWLNQPVQVMADVGIDWINQRMLIRILQEVYPALDNTEIQTLVQKLNSVDGGQLLNGTNVTKENLDNVLSLVREKAEKPMDAAGSFGLISNSDILELMESTSERKVSSDDLSKQFSTSTFSYGMHLVQTFDVCKCGNMVLEFRIWLQGDFRFYGTQEHQKNGWALECNLNGKNLVGVTNNYSDWGWKSGSFRQTECAELTLQSFSQNAKCGLGVSKVGPAYLDVEEGVMDSKAFLAKMNPYLCSFGVVSIRDNCARNIGLGLRMSPALCVNSNPHPQSKVYMPSADTEIDTDSQMGDNAADGKLPLSPELMMGQDLDFNDKGELTAFQMHVLDQCQDMYNLVKWDGESLRFDYAAANCAPCCQNLKRNVFMVLYNFRRDEVEKGSVNCCVTRNDKTANENQKSLTLDNLQGSDDE